MYSRREDDEARGGTSGRDGSRDRTRRGSRPQSPMLSLLGGGRGGACHALVRGERARRDHVARRVGTTLESGARSAYSSAMSDRGVVLVHGGAHGAWCWEPTIPHLTGRVLALDLPPKAIRGGRPCPHRFRRRSRPSGSTTSRRRRSRTSTRPGWIASSWSDTRWAGSRSRSSRAACRRGSPISSSCLHRAGGGPVARRWPAR